MFYEKLTLSEKISRTYSGLPQIIMFYNNNVKYLDVTITLENLFPFRFRFLADC